MTTSRTADEIRDWMIEKLTLQMNIKPHHLDLDEPIENQGVDSMQVAALVGELEEWLDCRFVDNPLVRYPSINELSAFLAQELQAGRTEIAPEAAANGSDQR